MDDLFKKVNIKGISNLISPEVIKEESFPIIRLLKAENDKLQEQLNKAESLINRLEMFFTQYKVGQKISAKVLNCCRLYFKFKKDGE